MWMSRISYGAGHDTRPQNLGTWLGPTMTTNSTQFPDSYFWDAQGILERDTSPVTEDQIFKNPEPNQSMVAC